MGTVAILYWTTCGTRIANSQFQVGSMLGWGGMNNGFFSFNGSEKILKRKQSGSEGKEKRG